MTGGGADPEPGEVQLVTVEAVAAGRDTEQHGIRDGEEGERRPGNGGPVDTRSPLSLRLSLRHAVILSGIAGQPKDSRYAEYLMSDPLP